MSDTKYGKYSLETLIKWRDKTDREYVEETLKPHGHWGDGMRLSKLPTLAKWNRLRDRLTTLNKEIDLRRQSEKYNGGKYDTYQGQGNTTSRKPIPC